VKRYLFFPGFMRLFPFVSIAQQEENPYQFRRFVENRLFSYLVCFRLLGLF